MAGRRVESVAANSDGRAVRARSSVLVTQRLELRASALDDLPTLHALWTDAAIRRFLFDDREIPSSEAQAFVEASLTDFADSGYGLWLVFEKGRAELAGFAGLLRSRDGSPNLVYGIRSDLTGRGYATEAALAVLRYSFQTLRLVRIFADVDAPNAASIRVLEKLGMSRIGQSELNGRTLLYFAIGAQTERGKIGTV